MRRADITSSPPPGAPPIGLLSFYRYFLREHRRILAWLFICGFGVACADAMVSVFVGKVVAFVGQQDRWKAWQENWPTLLAFLVAIGVVRPVLIYIDLRLRNDHLVPGATSRIRWISHWHVVRQSWSFFQHDYPGRLAHRVMHTAGSLRETAEAAIRAVQGVVDIERMRVRMVGPTYFIESIAKVPRTYPIDRVEEIKRKAQAAVRDALGDADLTFTAVPVARDNESVRERIMVIARNSGLAVHHVTVHDLGEKLIVSIDLEVDGEMPLVDAHDIAHHLEHHIREEFGEDVEVDTHIEPLEPELPHGTDASAERVAAIRTALISFADHSAIHDIHNVRVRDTDAGEIVNFHCRAVPSMSVIKVHQGVDEIERALRRAFPTVKRVISHAEPTRA